MLFAAEDRAAEEPSMRKQHVVVLSELERARLRTLIGQGSAPARALTRARILLKANQGEAGTGWSDRAAYAALPRPYRRAHHDPSATDVVALFAERAADYRAVVRRVAAADVQAAIAAAVGTIPSVLIPDGLPAEWWQGFRRTPSWCGTIRRCPR
jgi:hypothetical protein